MKKILLLLSLCFLSTTVSQAQLVSVNTNLAGWATFGTLNVGVEPALTPNMTLALDGYYNPFEGKSGKSMRLWGVQPEVRYWLKTKYTGHFFGLHSLYANYDFGRNLYRYDGWMSGVGLSYGYSFAICERWRISANIGAGWKHKDYEKSGLPQMGNDIIFYGNDVKNSFGITKAAINVTFIIR